VSGVSRSRVRSSLFALCAASACRHTPVRAVAPAQQTVIGDSTFAVRVLTTDRARGVARVALPRAAYVLALGLSYGGTMIQDVFPVGQNPLDAGSRTIDVPPRTTRQSRAALDACAARMSETPVYREERRRAVRDSLGRAADGGAETVLAKSGDISPSAARKACANPVSAAATATSGYLLVIASPTRLTPQLVAERLRVLRVYASDPRDAAEGFARGLYVDRDTTWAATLVAW